MKIQLSAAPGAIGLLPFTISNFGGSSGNTFQLGTTPMHLDNKMDLRLTPARLARFAPALYPAALFLSALLLFGIQPMFAKMVLPRIGGAAGVWSVAMV